MDREIVYPGQIPLDTHLLLTNRNAMVAIGALATAALGNSILVDGLAISASSSPNMTVNIAPGSIYAIEEVDSVSYGSLGTDTTQNTVKQGINLNSTPFTLTAPSGSGTTVLYLIEAELQETDTGSTVLPYYNSTNPNQPYSGPGNSGNPQNTLRTCVVGLQLVSTGVPFPTGTDPSATSGAVPPVDAGWTGLYLIPVNNGQTAITNTNLLGTLYPGAPFPPQKISTARQRVSASVVAPVSATGSDSWVQPTPFTPFATLQHAVNYLSNNIDFNGHNGTITLGAGTFSGAEVLGTFLGQSGNIVIAGAGSANTTLTGINANGIQLEAGAQVEISGMSISATGTGIGQGVCASCQGASFLTIGSDVKVLGAATCHFYSDTGGQIQGSAYGIDGSAPIHWNSQSGGSFQIKGGTLTVVGNPNFTTAFAVADYGAIKCQGTVLSGSCTGTAWIVTENGLLSTGDSGALLTAAGLTSGSTASGGQVT